MSTLTRPPLGDRARWNQASAAAAYDEAAPVIHPLYERVQHEVLTALADALPPAVGRTIHVLDLGGGSGRLAARLLADRPNSRVVVADPSEPFLRLARERLREADPSGERWELLRTRAQEDAWRPSAGRPPYDAVISTSALHHLEPGEKRAVFLAIHDALTPGGVFVNGDEHRPPSDAAYRLLLEGWAEQMHIRLASGAIPPSFGPMVHAWQERNLDRFHEPRASGDDCHETLDEQAAYLYGAGFQSVHTSWHERLWAVTTARC